MIVLDNLATNVLLGMDMLDKPPFDHLSFQKQRLVLDSGIAIPLHRTAPSNGVPVHMVHHLTICIPSTYKAPDEAHSVVGRKPQAVVDKREIQNNKLAKMPKYDIGKVWLYTRSVNTTKSTKLTYFWHGPWLITNCVSPVNYVVKQVDGKITKVVDVRRMECFYKGEDYSDILDDVGELKQGDNSYNNINNSDSCSNNNSNSNSVVARNKQKQLSSTETNKQGEILLKRGVDVSITLPQL